MWHKCMLRFIARIVSAVSNFTRLRCETFTMAADVRLPHVDSIATMPSRVCQLLDETFPATENSPLRPELVKWAQQNSNYFEGTLLERDYHRDDKVVLLAGKPILEMYVVTLLKFLQKVQCVEGSCTSSLPTCNCSLELFDSCNLASKLNLHHWMYASKSVYSNFLVALVCNKRRR